MKKSDKTPQATPPSSNEYSALLTDEAFAEATVEADKAEQFARKYFQQQVASYLASNKR